MSLAYPELALYINGEWLSGAGRDSIAVTNPATEELLGRLPVATTSDMDLALFAAEQGFKVWRATSALERGRLLQAISLRIRNSLHDLARIITLEQGKCFRDACQEVHNTADAFEWMAEEGKRAYGRLVPARTANTDQYVRLEPLGPVAAFSPWNFPAVLAGRKIATALAAGCSIVIKPSEETPGIVLAIARLCEEAGLPKGVLNVLYGEPADISKTLIASEIIRKVSFTGSVPVGRLLANQAAGLFKRITLELGGHAPVIIADDVNLDRVVALTLSAAFRNAGQICQCPTRFYVHDRVHDTFVQKLAEGASALKLGDGMDDSVQMGPLTNPRRSEAMEAFCADALQNGGEIQSGGGVPAEFERGHFWLPTVISELSPDALALREEVFGPMALIRRFDDLDQAITEANSTEYGLGAYAFTNSLETAYRIENGLEAGNVSINTYAISASEMPFSGVKSSGMGYEMGSEGLREYLSVKSVVRAAFA